MKILLFITSWDFGGAEVQVYSLAKKYTKLGNKVKIISMISSNTDFEESHQISGVEVLSLNMKKGKPSIKAIMKLKNEIKNYKPDVVHAHMIHAVIMARVLRLLVKIPKLISTAHSIDENNTTEKTKKNRSTLRDNMYRLTDCLSDINTNVSKKGTDLYIEKKKFSKEKTIYIPNGIAIKDKDQERINIKSIFRIPYDRFIFLAVGRIEPPKDYNNLINAVEILIKKKVNNFVVLIVGEGSLYNEISTKIKNNNLNEYVKLIGRREDVKSLLKEADSFVMSSKIEGLPIALLEALSVGLPAVVTDVGGCVEAVRDDFNGYVVQANNPYALADKMYLMINEDRVKYNKMKKNAIKIINDKYDIDIIVEKWLLIYRKSNI